MTHTDCALELRQSREALADDPFRPLYHFSPPGGQLHDPQGFCEWQGRYHLFYILAKGGKGHAVSNDLVRWHDLPPLPELGGLTGQVVTNEDRAAMTFSTRDGLFLATSSDPELLNWEKSLTPPLHTRPGYQQPIDSCIWRENETWREDDAWYIAARKHQWDDGRWYLRGTKPALELFRSEDLVCWESLGMLFEDCEFTEPGDDCACPNFLPIGDDKYLLLSFSHKRCPMYFIGSYDRERRRFLPDDHGCMSYGPGKRGSLHAPSAFVDSRGRCIAIFNIFENRPHQGWEEIMSLPRQLSLNDDVLLNPLRIEPVAGQGKLRFAPVQFQDVTIPANGEEVLTGLNGKAMELQVFIDPMDAREVGLHLLRSPNGEEQTIITLYMHGWERAPRMRELAIDVSRASLDPRVKSRSPEIGPLCLNDGDELRLRVFIDRSVIEVFANGRQCLTLRTYPSREDSNGVAVFARGSEAKLTFLRAWQMHSIWPELKAKEGQ